MAVSEDSARLPWDREPREPGIAMLLGGVVSIPLFLVACSVTILAVPIGLMVVGAMVENGTEATLLDWALSATILLALLAVCIVPFRLWLGVRRRVRLARCLVDDDSMIADITYLQARPEGPGSVVFRQGNAELTGTAWKNAGGYHDFWVLSLLLLYVLFVHVLSLRWLAVCAFALFVVFHLYANHRRHKTRPAPSRQTVAFRFTPEHIKSVRCVGPLVTIRFKRFSGAKLRAVRFFVAPHFREQFYREFEQVFPGYLPEVYRAAVANEG
jgi:hypothetical protein